MHTSAPTTRSRRRGPAGAIQVLTGSAPGDTTSFTGVAVTATAFQNLQTTAVGGSASLTAGIAGSVAVNDLKYTTLAYVDPGGEHHGHGWLAGDRTGRDGHGSRPAHAS